MEDKTIISLVAIIVLAVILTVIMLCTQDGLETKIALGASIAGLIATITAYAYGIERKDKP